MSHDQEMAQSAELIHENTQVSVVRHRFENKYDLYDISVNRIIVMFTSI